MTMAEIDKLRAGADAATERYRDAERAVAKAFVRLTEVALAPAMHCDDGALEAASDAYCFAEDRATDAKVQKAAAEAAVLAALRAWWRQGCKEIA